MLLINTKIGQIININSEYLLRLDGIDFDRNIINLTTLNSREEDETIILKTGTSEYLPLDVNLTVVRLVPGKELIATLGFDAPREISIRGDWITRIKKNIKSLSDAKLIEVGQVTATTSLEKELIKRLRRRINND